MTYKFSSAVKIWWVVLLAVLCLGAAALNAEAETQYLDPDTLIDNTGWTKYPDTVSYVLCVNDSIRQPSHENSSVYYDCISSADVSGQEIHTIKYGFEDATVNATSLRLWFYGSGMPGMYPLRVKVMSGDTIIQDWTDINMAGSVWDDILIDQSLTEAQLDALTVEIKRNNQPGFPQKCSVWSFYAEVTY